MHPRQRPMSFPSLYAGIMTDSLIWKEFLSSARELLQLLHLPGSISSGLGEGLHMFSGGSFRSLLLATVGVVVVILSQSRLNPARSAAAEPNERPPINFARDIQPILAENCFQCHGPDPKQRKAKLRLDVEKEALGHGEAIVPGHADKSELIERVSSADPDFRMPPPKTGKRLKPEQIALLRR